MPRFVAPMLASSASLPADDADWAFEVKWDGVRAIVVCELSGLRVLSRNGNEISEAYLELTGLKDALGSRRAILDGEIVAFNAEGRPSFEALQSRIHLRGESAVQREAQRIPITLMLFDLLWLDDHSLIDAPYSERRALLDGLALSDNRWQTPAYLLGEGAAMLQVTRELGLEGVVAKRLDSRYAPGRRSRTWLKVKHTARQEFVIGGWTTGKGSRASRFGALHLGVYEDGVLRYAGRVDTGYVDSELDRLLALLQPREQTTSPFEGVQPPRGARFVKPELVCEVEFTEWTSVGLLRHPVYKGLRDDKSARDVVREPSPMGAGAGLCCWRGRWMR